MDRPLPRTPALPTAAPPSRRAARRARARARRRRLAVAVALVALVVAAGLLVATLTGGPSAPGPAAVAGGTTVTWAEPPGTPPDYIFPFMPSRYLDAENTASFQYLMYRPLYWFGRARTADLDPRLSLARPPVYGDGGTTVTITLDRYRWSDGEAVTAQDVLFWMNMLAAEKANWGAYLPTGDAIPDDVAGVTVDSADQLTIQLTGAFNEQWFTDDELSQITPLPLAWDKTSSSAAPGSGGCAEGQFGTVDAQCAAVYTFLSAQAGYDPADPTGPNTRVTTYGTDPLWQVVDGPWRLRHLTTAGRATLARNPRYSGPARTAVRTFVEVPFATATAEYRALSAGELDVGYLPSEDVPGSTTDPALAGPNAGSLGSYTLSPLYTWSIDYVPYNFSSTGDGGSAGAIFSQLYVRQAVQLLVDQPGAVAAVAHGYGVPTYGPLPATPGTMQLPADPYPYDPGRATRLLARHGWKVAPGGTSTCAHAGSGSDECGTGIARGARLSFTLDYAAGDQLLERTLERERSSWARAGIRVSLVAEPQPEVLATATSCPRGCSWELASWGSGWLFSPWYYPTGDGLFATGAAYNVGDYADATNDANVQATVTTGVGLARYARYLAQQLPVIFEPTYASSWSEIRDGLVGVTPQSVVLGLDPERWHWAS